MRKVTAIMVVAAMLATAGTALGVFDPTNLAFNPDFETGDLTDWFTGGSSSIGIISDNGPSLPGIYCVQMATPGDRDLRSQGIPVTPGKEYQLTFDYLTSVGAANNPQVRFRFWDGLGGGGTYGNFQGEVQRTLDRTDGQWATVEPLRMVAPENAIAVDIVFTINKFGSFTGQVRFDNIIVQEEMEVGPAVGVSPAFEESGVLPTASLVWKAPRDPANPTGADPNIHSFVVFCDPNLARLEAATYDSHNGVPYFSDQLFVGDASADPEQTYEPVPLLAENTTYYWRVDSRKNTAAEPNDVYPGLIWSFDTNLAPENVAAVSDIVLPSETNGVVTVIADDPPGTGLSYQWYLDADPAAAGDEVLLTDGAKYAGTQTASLTVISPAAGDPSVGGDEGYYVCDVSNTSGTTRSNAARLVIGRLVNHYELENTLADSALGYDGAMAGEADPNWTAGHVGAAALELDGTKGALIDMSQAVTGYPAGQYPSTAQQVTVTAWVQAGDLSGWRTIVGNWGDGLFQLGVNSSGRLVFEVAQPGGPFYVTDGETFPTETGEWQFVAGVADGSRVHLYRMGADEAVTGRSFEVDSREYNGQLMFEKVFAGIGCYTDDGVNPLNLWIGKIDDVRIYNYGLSPEAVADLYGASVCLYSSAPGEARYLDAVLDLDDNCRVDLGDLAIMAAGWLDSGIYTP